MLEVAVGSHTVYCLVESNPRLLGLASLSNLNVPDPSAKIVNNILLVLVLMEYELFLAVKSYVLKDAIYAELKYVFNLQVHWTPPEFTSLTYGYLVVVDVIFENDGTKEFKLAFDV